jgi:hypothetical protein
MAHDCPDCGDLCYCDMDDTFMEENMDCTHWWKCEREMMEPYEDDFDAAEN